MSASQEPTSPDHSDVGDEPGQLAGSVDNLSIRLAVPDMWEQAPVEVDEFKAWIREQVTDLGLDETESAGLMASLGRTIVEARAAGLILTAGFTAGVISDDPEIPDFVSASLYIAQRDLGQVEGVLSSTAILRVLAESESDGDLSLLTKPEAFSLAGHDVVRVVSVERYPEDDLGPFSANVEVTFHFVLHERRSLLTLGFVTPCYWLIDDLVPLFDEIASTIEIEHLTEQVTPS